MKILITTDLYQPSVNGVVTSVLSLVHGLEARGHDIRILTLSADTHTHTEGKVTYLSAFGIGKLYPGIRIRGVYPKKAIRELVRWCPDIVHSQCEFSTFHIARLIARKCNAPLIHTYHTVYEDYTHYFSPSARMGRAMAAQFTRSIAKRTDAMIAPTEKVRHLLEGYHVHTDVSVIPTGLELAGQGEAQTDKDLLREKLGIPKDKRVLLFLGRLAEEKNIPELFSLPEAPALSDTVLVLVGDGPYRAALEAMVAERRLTGRVIFTGMIPHTQAASYYRMGDVFVNASSSETQGLTYIEAMAAGVPVVCRADPCTERLIQNGENGYACNTTAEMAQAVKALLDDTALAKRITNAASALVSAVYTSDAFAAQAERLYRETIGQKYRRTAGSAYEGEAVL